MSTLNHPNFHTIVLDSTRLSPGLRLDQLPIAQLSRKRRKQLIDQAGIRLNQTITRKASTHLKSGDAVSVFWPFVKALELKPSLRLHHHHTIINTPPLYEDDDLIVIHKPPGFLAEYPQNHRHDPASVFALPYLSSHHHPSSAQLPQLCHRLDCGTSGALILAKHKDAWRHLTAQFKHRSVDKTYLALVTVPPQRSLPHQPFDIHTKLHSTLNDFGKIIPSASGHQAHTHIQAIHPFTATTALLICKPIDGRTHQIRAHLDTLGWAVIGDTIYGQGTWQYLDTPLTHNLWHHHLLHAYKITFTLPATAQPVTITAPIPPLFQSFIHQLSPHPKSTIQLIRSI